MVDAILHCEPAYKTMLLTDFDPETDSESFSVHFLSSGSKGNCTLVREGKDAFVLDFGLTAEKFVTLLRREKVHVDYTRDSAYSKKEFYIPNPSPLSARLAGALLTHTHKDHWGESALNVLKANKARLFCHASHAYVLERTKGFRGLSKENLVSEYDRVSFSLTPRTEVTPLRLPHDSEHTFGFVFTHKAPDGNLVKFSYIADLGHFPQSLVAKLADSDLLAIEFNHDKQMERQSGRPPELIARVLGRYGHLSNEEAAIALDSVLGASTKFPHTVVLLHLSEDCNCPHRARAHAVDVLKAHNLSPQLIVARPFECAGRVELLPSAMKRPTKVSTRATSPKKVMSSLCYVQDDLFAEQ